MAKGYIWKLDGKCLLQFFYSIIIIGWKRNKCLVKKRLIWKQPIGPIWRAAKVEKELSPGDGPADVRRQVITTKRQGRTKVNDDEKPGEVDLKVESGLTVRCINYLNASPSIALLRARIPVVIDVLYPSLCLSPQSSWKKINNSKETRSTKEWT